MLVDPDERVDNDIFGNGIIAEALKIGSQTPFCAERPKLVHTCTTCQLPRADHATPSRCARSKRTTSTNSRLSRPLQLGSPTLPDNPGAISSHWLSFAINPIKGRVPALNQFSAALGILIVNRP